MFLILVNLQYYDTQNIYVGSKFYQEHILFNKRLYYRNEQLIHTHTHHTHTT